MRGRQQIEIFVEPVRGIDPDLDPAARDQAMDEIGDGRDAEFERGRQLRLRHAFVTVQVEQQLPLRPREAQRIGLTIEADFELPRQVVDDRPDAFRWLAMRRSVDWSRLRNVVTDGKEAPNIRDGGAVSKGAQTAGRPGVIPEDSGARFSEPMPSRYRTT